MSAEPGGKRIMIVAGEVSGDMHAARLVRMLRESVDGLSFFGIGGDLMAEEGVELVRHAREMEAIGFSEVIRRYPFFRRVFNEMLELAAVRKPDVAVFVDYPGFNLRLAKRIAAMGIRTVYYICPQVWAWNRKRIPQMASFLHHLITIFPFEAAHFAGTGLPVTFVGHPLVQETRVAWAAPEAALPWQGDVHIALLPGSRKNELEHILPCMWDAAQRIEQNVPGASFIIAAPNEGTAAIVQKIRDRLRGGPAKVAVVVGQTRQVLRQARAGLIASGTATIEAALMRCPMVVVYRTSWLTYLIGRALIRVRHLGMVNIVAGRTLCPELLQHRATGARLASALAAILEETPEREQMLAGLAEVCRTLGSANDAERAAAVIRAELAQASVRA